MRKPGLIFSRRGITDVDHQQTPSIKKGDGCHTGGLSAPLIKPPPDAWAHWIAPETLISQVRGTMPFLELQLPATEPGRLIELGHSPDGFQRAFSPIGGTCCAPTSAGRNSCRITSPSAWPVTTLRSQRLCLPMSIPKSAASSGANRATPMYCDP